MTRIQTAALGVFLSACALAYGVGWVNGHGASTTGAGDSFPPRAQSSALSARSLGSGSGANGSPAALDDGGGDREGRARSAEASPAPASTTVVSSVLSSESVATATVYATVAPKVSATVIISAQPPPASTSEKSSPVQPSETIGQLDTLEAQVRAAVEANFPQSEWSTAMAIAYRESRYQPWAVEPGGQHFGVFQVDPSLHGAVPSDIWGQVAQAAALWRREGWGPWQ